MNAPVQFGRLLALFFCTVVEISAVQGQGQESHQLGKRSPYETIVQEGQPFRLLCIHRDISEWKKNGRPVQSQSRLQIIPMGPYKALDVSKAQLGDSGLYECLATGGRTASAWSVDVYQKGVLSIEGIDVRGGSVEVYAGLTVVLRCVGKLFAMLAWREGNEYVEHRARHDLSRSRIDSETRLAVLSIRDVQLSDAGRYDCIGYPEFDGPYSRESVDVKVLRSEPIRFTVTPSNVSAYEGERVIVYCSAAGRPSPSVHWARETKTGVRVSLVKIATPDGRLGFPSLSKENEGIYECVAENALGKMSLRIRVSIRVADVHNMNVLLTHSPQSVLMTCNVSRTFSVAWLKDGKMIRDCNDSRLHFPAFDFGSALVIQAIGYADKGLYEARARVDGKLVYKYSVFLNIRGVPTPPRNVSITFKCSTTLRSTLLSVSWLPPVFRGEDDEENLLYSIVVTTIEIRHLKITRRYKVESNATVAELKLEARCTSCTAIHFVEVYAVNSIGRSNAALPVATASESSTLLKRNCNRTISSIPVLKSYPGFQIKLKVADRSCLKSGQTHFVDALQSAVYDYAKTASEIASRAQLVFEIVSNEFLNQFIIYSVPGRLDVDESIALIKALERPLRYDSGSGRAFKAKDLQECKFKVHDCNVFYAKGISRHRDCQIGGRKNRGCNVSNFVYQVKKFCELL